ncbi:hypothetical protein KJF94_14745 [Pseudomonas hormoni]|uniref:Uncharacterized protein n=1 Tax=Pseudomonas hormoni TaxID=3093767 RepID=A0ABX8F694_9PSED|nr:hypothetical protein [Pseudomonas hormoni]QVW27041.1 hypothetical protein KJF94_14745 [Pseudomonas hormoni]
MPFPPRFLEHYRKADRITLGLIWLMFFLFWVGERLLSAVNSTGQARR